LKRGFILSAVASAVLCLLALIFYFDRPFLLKFFSPFFLSESDPTKMDLASRLIYTGYQRLALGALLILFSFYMLIKGSWGSRFGIASLCLLLLLDLGSATYKSVRHDEAIFQSIETMRKGLEAAIAKDKTLYRVGSYKNALGPNIEMYLGYQTAGGFTALFPTRYYDYVNEYAEHQLPVGWENFTYGEAPAHTYMDLLNVKYGVVHSNKFCYVRETFLPRAFMVSGYKVMRKEEILKYIGRSDFEPLKSVLLEEAPKPTSAPSPGLGREHNSEQVQVTSYRPDMISLVTEAPEAGFLFLSEIYYPGWKAFIDGRPEPILRGDYLFRVIQVPSGRHEVTFTFDPFSIKIGIVITILTLFLLLALTLYRFRKSIFSH